MPVIDAARLIFVHVPKTAGVSALTALGVTTEDMAYDPRALTGVDVVGRYAWHYTLMEQRLARPDAAGYLATAVVREPYERVLSLWGYCVRAGHTVLPFREWARRLPWSTDSARC